MKPKSMDIAEWLRARATRGTKASMARRIAISRADYGTVERQLRRLHILEVLIANAGKHDAAANALKIHRHTIGRALKQLGLTAEQVRGLAKQLQEAANGTSRVSGSRS